MPRQAIPTDGQPGRPILLGLIDLSNTIYRRERALEEALRASDISLVGDQIMDLIAAYVGYSPNSDAAYDIIYSGLTTDQKADALYRLAA